MAESVSRRDAIGWVAATAMGVAHGSFPVTLPRLEGARIGARPSAPTLTPTTGLQPLGFDSRRDGLFYVPPGYRRERPLPLAILLHGAGQSAPELMSTHVEQSRASAVDLLLLAIDSRAPTWDAIRGDFGPDVRFLDRALRFAFARCAVDPARITIAGFSDGASYALSLGVANGDFASRVVAYSPGFLIDVEPVGRPKFLITHGTADRILPIDSTSRRLVPALERAGYDVDYREWVGPHRVPPDLLDHAVRWMAGG